MKSAAAATPVGLIQAAFAFLRRAEGSPVAKRAPVQRDDTTFIWKHGLVVRLARLPRLKRYLLSLRPDGTARLALPRRGSRAEAMRFLDRSEAWLLRRHAQWRERESARQPWREGTEFLFRGEKVRLEVRDEGPTATLMFGDQVVTGIAPLPDYRAAVQAHLRRVAERELPSRTRELALRHDIGIARVTIRAQKTRWGSCSARGTISLNWRLIQAPPFVLDYLIVHELMHRREMNHSARYWRLVETAFPRYREAEQWLKSRRIEGLE